MEVEIKDLFQGTPLLAADLHELTLACSPEPPYFCVASSSRETDPALDRVHGVSVLIVWHWHSVDSVKI